jgi:hypothetical protein
MIEIIPSLFLIFATSLTKSLFSVAITACCISCLCVMNLIKNGKAGATEIVLSLTPLGAQVTTFCSGKISGYPMLIHRNDILDVTVNEVVMPHKVVSLVVLRLKSSAKMSKITEEDVTQTFSIEELLKSDNVKIQPVFPGVELTFHQCLRIRYEICKALDLPIPS